MGAILAFLGSGAFRMIWGEFAAYFKNKQDFKHEQLRAELQGRLDAENFLRQKEMITLQHTQGVEVVHVKSDAAIAEIDARGWNDAVQHVTDKTGIKWVDAWNGSVRPLCATIAILLWVGALAAAGFKMGDWDQALVGSVLGFFFADRGLAKRGK